MIELGKQISAALVLALAASSPAHATGWLIYGSTGAGAISYGSYAQDRDRACSGSLASTAICGADAAVYTDASSLTLRSEAVALHDPRVNSGYGDASSVAYGSVDLTTGALRLSHASTVVNGFTGEQTNSSAQVSFADTLHFLGIVSPVSMAFDLEVSGLFEGFTQPRFSFNFSNGFDSLNNGTVGWSDGNSTGPSTTRTANFIDFGGGTGRSGNWIQYGPDRFVGTILLDPLRPDYTIRMALSAGGPVNTYSDFSHTAQLSLRLPEGVSYTSDSGVFLSAGAGIPEPATWAMLIAGVGAVGARLRRRPSRPALA